MNAITSDETVVDARPPDQGEPAFHRLLDTIAAGASERDATRTPPFEAVRWLKDAGIGALRLPQAEGGAGISLRELFDKVILIARADSNVAHILRNHFAFVERYVRPARGGLGAQWRGRVAGGLLFGLASTELTSAKAGRAGDLKTRLTRAGEAYVLNGTKYYSTGSLYCDYVQVRAQADDGRQASVLVPAERAGVVLADDWDGMGQSLTGSGSSHFTDVAIAPDEIIFDADGLQHARHYNSTFAQLYLTTVNAGILEAILRDAKDLIRGRGRSFYYAPTERPADDPVLLQTIGQISAFAFVARSAVLAAASALDAAVDAHDQGLPSDALALEASLAAAKAKIVVDELAIKAGGMLFDVGGASATKKDGNLDIHWRNARTLASHNPGAYKALAIGGYEVNGVALPNGSFF